MTLYTASTETDLRIAVYLASAQSVPFPTPRKYNSEKTYNIRTKFYFLIILVNNGQRIGVLIAGAQSVPFRT